jgi:hypothetical protein
MTLKQIRGTDLVGAGSRSREYLTALVEDPMSTIKQK